MKLWYQSAVEFRSDHRWQLYESSLKSHISQFLNQKSTFCLQGMDYKIDRYKAEHNLDKYRQLHFYQKAIFAERQGFSSFAIGCWRDYANGLMRKNTKLIVISIAEASLHAALILGRRPGLIMANARDEAIVRENLKNYGIEQSSVIFSNCIIEKEISLNAFLNPTAFYDHFTLCAKGLIDRGADVIVAGHGVFNEILYNMKLRSIGDTPILDSTSALITTIGLFDK
jgi:Asp/Glu/hydantoin racemase